MRNDVKHSAALLLSLALFAGCGIEQRNGPRDGAVVEDGSAPPDAPPDASGPAVTTIRVHYPAGGRGVTLRGSGGGLDWAKGMAMTAGADDTFTAALPALASTIEWKCLLDDKDWSLGPNYHIAPGQQRDVYPHFSTTNGMVSALYSGFTSQRLQGTKRTIWVYLPPTYQENSRARLPVVYMHDGQNLFDPKLAFGGNPWKVDQAIDTAAGSGRCPDGRGCQNDGDCGGGARCDTFTEPIVIGIENTADRIAEYTPVPDPDYGGGKGEAYLDMVVLELKPRVDADLRTLPDRAHTVIVGSSLGGLISAHAGLTRGDTFGRIGALSPSSWWDKQFLAGEVASAAANHTPRSLKVYVDSGDAGVSNDDVTDTNALAAAYLAAGYVEGSDFHHLVAAGHQHNETYWALRLPGALMFLLDPR